jgi:tRNA (cytidine/uridine-2'-O-)-methyltransferase
MHLALYQPEIPQNCGTLIRLGACLGAAIDVIEPCGFVWTDRHLRRAGMDYMELSAVERHPSWQDFLDARKAKRLVLIDTDATINYVDFAFDQEDVLLVGQESSGFPIDIKIGIQHQVKIPMLVGRRSLNVAIAAAIVLSEALRQTGLLPGRG